MLKPKVKKRERGHSHLYLMGRSQKQTHGQQETHEKENYVWSVFCSGKSLQHTGEIERLYASEGWTWVFGICSPPNPSAPPSSKIFVTGLSLGM